MFSDGKDSVKECLCSLAGTVACNTCYQRLEGFAPPQRLPPTVHTTTTGYVFIQDYLCPHYHECTDKGEKCKKCKHTPMRSYFEPMKVQS
jgi:hypothetical protein